LGVLPPNLVLDWELACVEDEDASLVIMDAFENDFFRKFKVARPKKTKGRREILNLVSTINYGDASASSQHRKGKVHVL
jgi:hypothetical protein